MIKILYVHGYNGKSNGESFQKLTKYAEAENFGGEKVEMYSFEYDEANPFKAVRALKHYYYEKNIDLIIGASLGGFIAASCEFARRIVVNPCWSPSVELPKIGYSDSVKDYKALEKSLGRFAEDEDGELCIGCFATEDELLRNKYKDDFCKSFKETYDIPGGHNLSEEAAKMIMTEIAPMLIERFKTCEGVGQITGNGLNETQRLLYAHMFSIYNEDSIKKSEKCGCFYCMEVFPTSMVEDFAIELGNNPNTALCPYCMIDSILAEADWKDLSPEFLRRMYDYFF